LDIAEMNAAPGEPHGCALGSPLSGTVATDAASGATDASSKEWAQAELERIVAASTKLQLAQSNLPRAEELARDHMEHAKVRFMLLQLRELAGFNTGMTEQWSELLQECPNDLHIVRHCASRLVRDRHIDDALALIDGYLPESTTSLAVGFARAQLLGDIRAHEQSDALFRRLIEQFDRRDVRIEFAKRLSKRGQLGAAVEVMEPIVDTLAPSSKAAQMAAGLILDYHFFRRYESAEGMAGQDVKILSMKHAILHFRTRTVVNHPADRRASVALVTGSLGPGGAERQLTRLAGELRRLSTQPRGEADEVALLPGSVEVLVKQHSEPVGSGKNQRLDFFLGSLLEAGVPVTEINTLPAVSVAHQSIDGPDLVRLLEHLPPPVHYGVTRLTPWLRERAFDVVSLWQDGTCLFGALAALLAGVPTIHLVFRGLPPNIRRDRYRPEYIFLYQALAQVPGVHFVSNSRAGAQEYASWLGIPLERFHILYNGVPELTTASSDEDEQKWRAFNAHTADATETIGGVFRLEPDKRPLLWIKLAARYLKQRPAARFVIVGDGRLQENVVTLAQELGVMDRLLLVGLSSHVGYWYSRMDVKVLLSRYEGLPNVLIEAQLLGIAAVSTPAGGAGECFVDNVTGHLLGDAEHPDLRDACLKIASLVDAMRVDDALRDHSRNRARMLFSVSAMIGRFMELCTPMAKAREVDARNGVPENLMEA